MNKMVNALARFSLAVVTLLVSQMASAAVIGSGDLDFSGRTATDIQVNALDFNYDASTGDFNISSSFAGANYTKPDGTDVFKDNWMFEIDGDYANGELVNTTLSVVNVVSTATILSGELEQFSIAGPGVFNFLFGSLGGSKVNDFGLFAGVIFSDISAMNFDFSNSFSSSYMGNANAFGVSEPGTFALLALGVMGLVATRRKVGAVS